VRLFLSRPLLLHITRGTCGQYTRAVRDKALANLVLRLRSPSSLPPAQIIGRQRKQTSATLSRLTSRGGVLRQAPRRVARACTPHASPRGARGSGGWRTARGRCARTSACRPCRGVPRLPLRRAAERAGGQRLAGRGRARQEGKQKGPGQAQRLPVYSCSGGGAESKADQTAARRRSLAVAGQGTVREAARHQHVRVPRRHLARPPVIIGPSTTPARSDRSPLSRHPAGSTSMRGNGTRESGRRAAGGRARSIALRRPACSGAAGKWPKRHAGSRQAGQGAGRQRQSACSGAVNLWHQPG